MSITKHNVTQGTEEWHKLREPLYTGSNAYKLLITKDKNYAKAGGQSWGGNFSTRRGHTLEHQAIKLYEAIKDTEVEQVGFVTNDKYPGCGYSPDGLVPDRTIEVKAFNDERQKANAKELEMEIMAQVQFGQLICGVKLTDVLLYNPDADVKNIKDKLIIKTVKRNPAIHANFIRRLNCEQ